MSVDDHRRQWPLWGSLTGTLATGVALTIAAIALFYAWGLIAGHDDTARLVVKVVSFDDGRTCIQPTGTYDQADYGGCFATNDEIAVAVGDCVEARVPYRAAGSARTIKVLGVVEPGRCS